MFTSLARVDHLVKDDPLAASVSQSREVHHPDVINRQMWYCQSRMSEHPLIRTTPPQAFKNRASQGKTTHYRIYTIKPRY